LYATRVLDVSRRNARKLIAEYEAGLGTIGQCERSYAFIPGAETGPRLWISIADIFVRTRETVGFVPFPFTLSLTRPTSSFGVHDCSVTHGITKVDGRAYPKTPPRGRRLANLCRINSDNVYNAWVCVLPRFQFPETPRLMTTFTSSFIAGGIAACGAVTVTHGFETVKIRCLVLLELTKTPG
jgi:hypothetical protein